MKTLGVDGCRAGWVFFGKDDVGDVRADTAARFDAVMAALPPDARVLVDIPIGLPMAIVYRP